jgi:hypothetical protein
MNIDRDRIFLFWLRNSTASTFKFFQTDIHTVITRGPAVLRNQDYFLDHLHSQWKRNLIAKSDHEHALLFHVFDTNLVHKDFKLLLKTKKKKKSFQRGDGS